MRKQALWLSKEQQESRLRDHLLHVSEEQQEEASEQGSGT